MMTVEAIQELFHTYQNGRFEIKRVCGIGGMGIVVEAYDTVLEVIRAIKIFNPGLLQDKEMVARFFKEARMMAKITHQNILQVYDIGEVQGNYFIVLEWVDGGTLSDHLEVFAGDPPKGMPPRQVLGVIYHICQALSVAHDLGIIHRDMKPDNVLLTKSGVPKVADFGIARMNQGTSLTGEQVGMGTKGYMPEEQMTSAKSVDARADVHALGVTLWAMLTAQQPPGLLFFHDLEENPEMLKDIPACLHSVIRKATEFKARDRYASIHTFVNALREIEDQLPPLSEDVAPIGTAIAIKRLLKETHAQDEVAKTDLAVLRKVSDPATPESKVGHVSDPTKVAKSDKTQVSDSWGKHVASKDGSLTPLPDTGVGHSGTHVYGGKGTMLGSGAPASSPKVPLHIVPKSIDSTPAPTPVVAASSSTKSNRSFIVLLALSALVVGVGAFLAFSNRQSTILVSMPIVSVPVVTVTSDVMQTHDVAIAIASEPSTTVEPTVVAIAVASVPEPATVSPTVVVSPAPVQVEKRRRKEGKKEKVMKPVVLKAGEKITIPVPVEKKVRIDVKGDGADVWVVGASGKVKLPASVEPGTYRVVAKFEDEDEAEVIKHLKVVDSSITIKCQASFSRCSAH
jgi:serine/threonine protein kinase